MGGHIGAPHTDGLADVIEGCHGFAGAPRALGGMGGHFGAPHLINDNCVSNVLC